MTERKRVVFVTQRFPPDKGGNAARIHDVATKLDGNWDVTVLAPPPSYPPGEFERSWQRKQTDSVDGVTAHRLWSWQPTTENPGMAKRMPYYLIFGIHAMVWLLWNRREYQVVVTTTPPISTGAPGLVATVLGKPWIVDVRDLWIDASISLGYLAEGGVLERVSRRFQWLVLHTADRIAVTTESLGTSLESEYGESLASKRILIPNGVDTDRFQPQIPTAPQSEQVARANGGRSGTGEVEPIIIYTGNLGSAQDLESCIRAMAHLEVPATLKLVGSGDMESKLRELCDELGLQHRVEFVGLVDRDAVPALLADATVGIAPLQDTDELAYAMPTKVYEYLASGLPTVVTGRGELERFIEDSGGGVHADNDPEAIATAIEGLLTDWQRRQQLAVSGRSHVEATYDRQDIADRLGEELDELARAG